MTATRSNRVLRTVLIASVGFVLVSACGDDSNGGGGGTPGIDAGEDGSITGTGGTGGGGTGGRAGSGGDGGAAMTGGSGGEETGGSGGEEDAGALDSGGGDPDSGGNEEDAGALDSGGGDPDSGGNEEDAGALDSGGGEADSSIEAGLSAEAGFDAAPEAAVEAGADVCGECIELNCNLVVENRETVCAGSVCDDLLACFADDDCNENDARTCYCGNVAFTTCFASSDMTLPNGVCKTEIDALLVAGGQVPIAIPSLIAPHILNTTNPVGAAMQESICVERECSAECFE